MPVREKNLQYVLDWIALQELAVEYGQAIDYGHDTGAEVMAYAEIAHYFLAGGVQHEWTIVARYSFSVEKTPDGWRIRKVLLDPVHYRGNPVGQELLRGKTLA
jgi:hypothetical protein